MKLIIGGQYYSTLDAQSLSITRSATDPVPTCTLDVIDNTSSLSIQPPAEILVLDDKQISNTTANLALNPGLNPYTSLWTTFSGSGLTLSQNPGGGLIWTFSNCTLTPGSLASLTLINGSVVPGVTYIFSAYVQGGSSPTNIGASLFISWQDAGGNAVGSTLAFNGPVPISTTLTRYTVSGVAPAGAVKANIALGFQRSSTTNSGTITWTQLQFEPEWFPTQTYPTPWCGPSQTNCRQLPLGYWIRQYRKFAGFVNRIVAQNYHGNVRTLQIDAVGYAWLLGLVYANDGFSNQTDAQIVTTLLNKYLVESGTQNVLTFNLVSTANVVTGVTISSMQLNWDDLRSVFDGLVGTSTFYWNIDDYWGMNYAPPGYFNQSITLICDNSSRPDNVTTFPGYEFSAETDFTQPGSTILCLGSGSNVSGVFDPAQIAQLSQLSGYYLPVGSSWMRKVNDSTLGSTTDTTNRAQAELLIYDLPRTIYHVKTNVELIPGQSVQLTSATEGLNKSTQLIQQVQATWLGTDETLEDVWEYQADLGAVNRRAVNILSRIFRITQKGTSAPAISTTTLEVFEKESITGESITTSGVLVSNYFAAVQPDGPTALYSFGEIAGGTIADDVSGNANQATATGGITEGATGLLTDPADAGNTAWTFNGTNAVVTLPTSLNGNGHSAITVEVWTSLSTSAPGTLNGIVTSTPGTANVGYELYWQNANTIGFKVANGSSNAIASFAITATAGVTLYLAGTYDGSNVKIYSNGVLKATTAYAGGNISASAAPTIGAYTGATNFYPGTMQYAGIYIGTALTATQISNHYTAGT